MTAGRARCPASADKSLVNRGAGFHFCHGSAYTTHIDDEFGILTEWNR